MMSMAQGPKPQSGPVPEAQAAAMRALRPVAHTGAGSAEGTTPARALSAADSAARVMATEAHLILGGQRSGKTRYGEHLVAQWLQGSASRRALYVATAQALDAAMQQRIAAHQRERARRLPRVPTLHAPLELAQALRTHSRPDTLLLVDCLGMWLMNWLMPPLSTAPSCATAVPSGVVQSADAPGVAAPGHTPQMLVLPDEMAPPPGPSDNAGDEDCASPPLPGWPQQRAAFLHALAHCSGPVVMVSSEISLGVIPLGAQVRAYVDALGLLHQDTAAQCGAVTLMVAGLPVAVKRSCSAGQ